ncbi:phosphoribosylaminoimidazolesuccinocarboxamide synthase [Azospirillum oleiclasticum]|uniref:phosphoribosylaminoimidazolesuccinocarboxamide synthase n=1 Tax=Azospirillum oleiclasticum TaxID=2735135 RepID=UPI0015D51F91|nr:phosphoribosylaminoimidazolesuccinocarboxamide synthase [Azospirillum oleiclasticum]
MGIDTAALAPHLGNVLADATIPELPNHYRGKVRDNYDLPDGRRIIIATDRLSAFDRILTCVPFKGEVLTQVARFWFERTADLCANHVLAYPDPNVVVCKRLTILPVEFVVRDYITGTTSTSIWSMYKAGRREMYGHRFPEGLTEHQKLPGTILTPTTKADFGGHDEPVSPAEILERGLLTAEQWETVSATALALFARGREIAAGQGLILADTKYEFGVDGEGNILLADEIHTSDSSRYWFADSYAERLAAGGRPDSFDKDFIRTWVSARCDPYAEDVPEIPADIVLEASRIYIDLSERITGLPFTVPAEVTPVLERIRGNLKGFF